MHAIQYSYAIYPVICLVNHWLIEGTAQWVEDYIGELRNRQGEHLFAHEYFDHMDEPLDKPATWHFEYGRYLFFFFLGGPSRSAADVIRATFQPYDVDPTPHLLTVLDAALQATGHGDLRSVWPNFTVSNWNRPPAVDDYLQWDGLNQGAKGEVINLNLVGGSSITKRLRPEAWPLSARYYHVTVDPSVRSLTIFNPFADGDDSAALRALVKVRGRPWRTDDWSRDRYVTFCLQLPSQDVEELVLISSNTDWHHPDHVLNDDIILEANNVSCLGWTMTGTESEELTISGVRTDTKTASVSGNYLTTAPLDAPYGTSPSVPFAFAGGQMTASEVIVDTISSCTTTTGPVTAPLSAEPAPGISSAFLVRRQGRSGSPPAHLHRLDNRVGSGDRRHRMPGGIDVGSGDADGDRLLRVSRRPVHGWQRRLDQRLGPHYDDDFGNDGHTRDRMENVALFNHPASHFAKRAPVAMMKS